jgi:hypothetical protein
MLSSTVLSIKISRCIRVMYVLMIQLLVHKQHVTDDSLSAFSYFKTDSVTMGM